MSRFPFAAVAAPKSAPNDKLESIANRRDFPALVKHMNAGRTDIGRVRSVLASVADTGDLLMHRGNEPGALDTLNPVGFRAGRLVI